MIWSLISGFFSNYLAEAVIAVGGVALAVWANLSGRKAERHKLAKMRLEASEEARKIEREVHGEGDEDLIDRVTGRS